MSFAVVMQAHTDHSTSTTVTNCPEKCYGTTPVHTWVIKLAQAIIYTPDLDTQQLYRIIMVKLIYSITVLVKKLLAGEPFTKNITKYGSPITLHCKSSALCSKINPGKICSSTLFWKIKTYKIGFFFGYLFLFFQFQLLTQRVVFTFQFINFFLKCKYIVLLGQEFSAHLQTAFQVLNC